MARKRKKRLLAAVIVAVFLLQFPLLRHFWLTQIGEFLIYQDRIAPADAILVLGGGRRERVVQGDKLFKEKFGQRVLFTGEFEQPLYYDRYHWAVSAQKIAGEQGIPEDKTILILDSKSTHDDATLSKEVCLKDGFKSLIVVSEPYHTRRAHWVFKKVFKDSGIKVMVYPVQKSWYTGDTWWHTEEGLQHTNSEYVKMVYYLLKGYI